MLDETPWIPAYALEYYHNQRQRAQSPKPWHKISSLLKKKNQNQPPPREEYERIVKEIQTREKQFKEKNTAPLPPEEAEELKKLYSLNYRKMMTKYSQASPVGEKITGIIDAPIIDVRAEESDEKKFDPKRLSPMTFGQFRLETVPGNHDTLFVEPAVSKIAEILRKI